MILELCALSFGAAIGCLILTIYCLFFVAIAAALYSFIKWCLRS
jgi:hypothetical protein